MAGIAPAWYRHPIMWTHPVWIRYAPFATVVAAACAVLALLGGIGQADSTRNSTTIIYPPAPVQPAATAPAPSVPMNDNSADYADASPAVEAPPATEPGEKIIIPEAVPAVQSRSPLRTADNSVRSRASTGQIRRAPREEPQAEPYREPAPLVFRHVAQ
jgi:hypothetical protein